MLEQIVLSQYKIKICSKHETSAFHSSYHALYTSHMIWVHWYGFTHRQLTLLYDTIKAGVSDANPTSRHFMRRAYWGLYDNFPSTAHRCVMWIT